MKYLYITLGLVCLALGAVGAVIPLLPATPFLLGTCFFFAKGSDRLNQWFLSTKLYKNNFKSFHEQRAMRLKTKITIMVTVTLTMTIGFVMMQEVLVGRIVLGCVWLFHMYYFIFRIRTLKPQQNTEN